ncbi:S8 family serine peptidase [bacterium]|nr:S8 family serine peptidase [bacterium]
MPGVSRAGSLFVALSVLVAADAASGATIGAGLMARAEQQGEVAVLVAMRPGRRSAAALPAAPPAGVRVAHAYRTVDGFAATVTAEGLAALAASPDVDAVELDGVGTVALARTVRQIRADRVHARGVDGSGVVIAVIDTGVDETHPDIAGALRQEECFCRAGAVGDTRRRACCPNGQARQSGPGSAASVNHHGPHVAGIAVSRGVVSPPGVAPGAGLVAVRVLDNQDRGLLSDWIAALDWIASDRPDVRVVNMSLVSAAQFAGDCEIGCGNRTGCAANRMFAQVIDRLWQRGTLVFAASGNEGRANAMSAPACVSRAVSVSAVDGADAIARFSNRSATLDLFAPGVGVVSDGLAGGLAVLSGTSMAAPHAAGTAALLIAARPGLTAAGVLALMRDSGVPIADGARRVPRLDAFAALRASMRSPELVRGGGSRASDGLLELSIIPPEAVSPSARALVRCVDNDPLCDSDQALGRCTFGVALCVNMRDPLLRQCATNEPLEAFAILAPPVTAPAGSIDRLNVDNLAFALPDFPFRGQNACSLTVPFVVERPRADAPGSGEIRMRLSTATRPDYDRVRFRCDPP